MNKFVCYSHWFPNDDTADSQWRNLLTVKFCKAWNQLPKGVRLPNFQKDPIFQQNLLKERKITKMCFREKKSSSESEIVQKGCRFPFLLKFVQTKDALHIRLVWSGRSIWFSEGIKMNIIERNRAQRKDRTGFYKCRWRNPMYYGMEWNIKK